MSDEKTSMILYSIAAVAGLICGLLKLHVYTPIFPGVVIGAVAGYFYEKHRLKKMYDEPYFFTLSRLSIGGAVGGVFLSLAAYQIVTWIVE